MLLPCSQGSFISGKMRIPGSRKCGLFEDSEEEYCVRKRAVRHFQRALVPGAFTITWCAFDITLRLSSHVGYVVYNWCELLKLLQYLLHWLTVVGGTCLDSLYQHPKFSVKYTLMPIQKHENHDILYGERLFKASSRQLTHYMCTGLLLQSVHKCTAAISSNPEPNFIQSLKFFMQRCKNTFPIEVQLFTVLQPHLQN